MSCNERQADSLAGSRFAPRFRAPLMAILATVIVCILGSALSGQQRGDRPGTTGEPGTRRLAFEHPPRPSGGSGAVTLSADGRWLAAVCGDGVVRLWDLTGVESFRVLEPPSGYIFSLAFSGDGRALYGSGKASVVRIWNIPSGSLARDLPLGEELMLARLATSGDGRWLAAAAGKDYTTLLLWDLTTDSAPQKIQTSRGGFEDFLTGIAFSADSRLRAAANRQGKTIVANVGTGEIVADLSTANGVAPNDSLRTHPIAFSPDGRWVATGDKTLTLWDARTWKQVRTWASTGGESGLGYNRTLAFSPDGRFLAGTSNRAVRLWEIPSGRRIAQNEIRHRDNLSGVAFAPSGRWFVTVGSDGFLGFWEATTGRFLASLATMSKSDAWAIASADGRFDGSPEGIAQIIGWREGNEKFPASRYPDAQIPGLLAQIASGKHTPRTEAGLERARMTVQEGQALLKAQAPPQPKEVKKFFPDKGAAVASSVSAATVQSFDALVEVLRRQPLYGGSQFSADALRKIFEAAECDPANILAARAAPDTGVVLSYDKKGRQTAILNVIRPEGLNQFPLVYVNPTRMLYSPETGFGGQLSPLVVMRGGTVVDSDLGVYRVTKVAGSLFGVTGDLVGLEGQLKQILAFENGRINRGVMFSKSGKLIRFFVSGKRIVFPMEDLEALGSGDTLSLPGVNGVWWTAEIRSGLDAAGVIQIKPARARIELEGQEQDVKIDELVAEREGQAEVRTVFLTPRARLDGKSSAQ